MHRALFLISILVMLVGMSGCGDTEESKAKYYNRGMAFFDEGNYTKARLEFKNLLQIDPKHAKGYFMLASLEEKERNWREAFALLLRATELDPDYAEAWVRLGRFYVLARAIDKAQEAVDKALAIKPGNVEGRLLQGLIDAKSGNREKAITLAETVLREQPGNVDAVSLLASLYEENGELDRAVALIQKKLVEVEETIVLRLLLVKFYDAAGDADKAIEQLEKIIEQKPDDLARRTVLANFYNSIKEHQKAEKVLQEIVTRFPDELSAKLNLVAHQDRFSAAGQAEQTLINFTQSAPENHELSLALVKFLIEKNRAGDAFSAIEKLIEAAAGTAIEGEARIARAKLLLKELKTEAAVAEAEIVLDKNPKDIEALLVRSVGALSAGDTSSVIADMRTVLREEPGNVRALRLKARAHLINKELELAKQSLEQAVEAAPQEAAANVELTRLLMATGELDGAVELLEKMRRFAPEDQSILLAMVRIRSRQGQWDEVMELGELMIGKSPDKPLGYHYKGAALQARKNYPESIRFFEIALDKAPEAIEPLTGLVKSLLLNGEADRALERVLKVIDKTPNHYLAQNLAGEILFSKKRLKEAENRFNRSLALKETWPTPYLNLSKLALSRNDIPTALRHLKEGYQKTSNISLGLEYALLVEKSGNAEEAIWAYQSVLAKKPGIDVARNNLAMLLIANTQDRQVLDRAMELVAPFKSSDNPIYLDSVGWIHFKRNEMVEAAKLLEKAHAQLKNRLSPEINYHLAEVYLQQGKESEAVGLLEKALEGDAKFVGVERARQLLEKLLKPAQG